MIVHTELVSFIYSSTTDDGTLMSRALDSDLPVITRLHDEQLLCAVTLAHNEATTFRSMWNHGEGSFFLCPERQDHLL